MEGHGLAQFGIWSYMAGAWHGAWHGAWPWCIASAWSTRSVVGADSSRVYTRVGAMELIMDDDEVCLCSTLPCCSPRLLRCFSCSRSC